MIQRTITIKKPSSISGESYLSATPNTAAAQVSILPYDIFYNSSIENSKNLDNFLLSVNCSSPSNHLRKMFQNEKKKLMPSSVHHWL
jgi:hypothetical protein